MGLFKYYRVKLEFKSFIEFKYTGYDSLTSRVKVFLFQVFNYLTFTVINLSFTENFKFWFTHHLDLSMKSKPSPIDGGFFIVHRLMVRII